MVTTQASMELADASQADQPSSLSNTPGASSKHEQMLPSNAKAKKSLSFYMTFLALNICVLLVSLDATALAVAVPVITHALHGTTLEAFWASLCFLLAVVAVMPIITSLSDVLGRQAPLYASFIVFIAGSIVFAVADSMGVLILGRVLQGLGGGGLDVLGEVVLADITSLKERPLYLGLFSIPMAGGAICGPIVGAALAQNVGWRWIGWINLPLGVCGLLLFIFFLRLKPIETTLSSKLARLDWIGMLLFVIGSALFSLPLSWAGSLYPWASYKTYVPFVLGLVVLTSLGFYEARPVQPLFPYRIFKSRTAISTLVGSFIHGAVLNGGLLYVLLSFQTTFRDSPFRSAVEVLPICVFIVVFSIIGAVGVEILRKYKLLTIAAWPCLAVGVGLFAMWKPGVSGGMKYGPQILAGVGLGILFTICTFPMNASQHVDDAGLATGIMVSFRMFGSMTGLAIGSTVFHTVFEQRISKIDQLSDQLAILRDAREAVGFIASLREVDHSLAGYDAVIESYRVSFMAVFLVLAGMGVVGFIFSLFIKELSLENDEVGRQGFEGN
ncbi:Major facilitator superfamily domain, general substrate transporter [Metarhizium rileyi]|uniref:Major facilitator superfamily domain, general substrate transporter n=1 Tax=Metarhizium rileyi (strain RCEF 4871) TaxID=1649241 RepID=A0A162HV11_METRR|nr:Major facilitator superfamily domain, general substrate transporter [Metarhizium rileyi RCEF 4871]